jgi:amidase
MLKTIRRSAIVLITQAVLMGLLPASVLAATFELEEATIADINI